MKLGVWVRRGACPALGTASAPPRKGSNMDRDKRGGEPTAQKGQGAL
jgi:hypothetical protein